MTSTSLTEFDQFEERIAKENGLDVSTWLNYLSSFAKSMNITTSSDSSSYRQLNILFERAIRAIPKNFKLWNWYLEERQRQLNESEQQEQEEEETTKESIIDSVETLFQRAVAAFSSTGDNNNADSGSRPMLSIFEQWFQLCYSHQRFKQCAFISAVAEKMLHPAGYFIFCRFCLMKLTTTTNNKNNILPPIPLILEILRSFRDQENRLAQLLSSSSSSRNSTTTTSSTTSLSIVSSPSIRRSVIQKTLEYLLFQRNCFLETAKFAFWTANIVFVTTINSSSSSSSSSKKQTKEQEHQIKFMFSLLQLVRKSIDDIDIIGNEEEKGKQVEVMMMKQEIDSLCTSFIEFIWKINDELFSKNKKRSNNNLLLLVGIEEEGDEEGDNDNTLSSISSSIDLCRSVVTASSCLSRIGLFQSAREIIENSFPHATNDTQVQTLHICLVVLNRETESLLNKDDDDNINQEQAEEIATTTSSAAVTVISNGIDISVESMRKQIAVWRTVRDPENPVNWLELISLTPIELLTEDLFQRAIKACSPSSSSSSFYSSFSTTKQQQNQQQGNTRVTHLYLAYSYYLEFQAETSQPQKAVDLLRRTASSSSSSNNNVILLHSDRITLLCAAAEILLRTSTLDRTLMFLSDVCDEIEFTSSSSSSSSSSSGVINISSPSIASPLWSMRVELYLSAMNDLDQAVSCCWEALKKGTCTVKLLLVVCDVCARFVRDQKNNKSNNNQQQQQFNTNVNVNTVAQLLHSAMQLIQQQQNESFVSSSSQQKIKKNKIKKEEDDEQNIIKQQEDNDENENESDKKEQQQQQQQDDEDDEENDDNNSRSLTVSGSADELMLFATCCYFFLELFGPDSGMEMIRQLHKSHFTTNITNNNATVSASYFALGIFEDVFGLHSNAIQAFKHFCVLELIRSNNNQNNNIQNKNIPSAAISAFSFYLRRVAQVIPGTKQLTSEVESVMLLRNISTNNSSSLPVSWVLEFGLQLVLFQLAAQQIDRARETLSSLSELEEDPRKDESGVWKMWQEIEVRTRNERGFDDMLRKKRDIVFVLERESRSTALVGED